MRKTIPFGIAMGGLLCAYAVLGYSFVPFHGLTRWPLVLFIIGAAVIIGSGLALKQYVLPLLTLAGYVGGFVLGMAVQPDSGVNTAMLRLVWTAVFAVGIVAGAGIEVLLRRRKAKKEAKQAEIAEKN